MRRFLSPLVACDAGEGDEQSATNQLAFESAGNIELADTAIGDTDDATCFGGSGVPLNHGAIL